MYEFFHSELNWFAWMAFAGILGILEMLLPGIFLVWGATGAALVGIFVLIFPAASFELQLFVLAVGIAISVLSGLRWQKRIKQSSPNNLNEGTNILLGRVVPVSVSFSKGYGRIAVDDTSYPAVCDSEEEIVEVGSLVRIVSTAGPGTFRVTPVLDAKKPDH